MAKVEDGRFEASASYQQLIVVKANPVIRVVSERSFAPVDFGDIKDPLVCLVEDKPVGLNSSIAPATFKQSLEFVTDWA